MAPVSSSVEVFILIYGENIIPLESPYPFVCWSRSFPHLMREGTIKCVSVRVRCQHWACPFVWWHRGQFIELEIFEKHLFQFS